MTLGEPIWIESTLTAAEWKEQSKIFPSTYHRKTPPKPFDCEFKWRYGMGKTLSPNEVTLISERIDFVLLKAGLKKTEEEHATV